MDNVTKYYRPHTLCCDETNPKTYFTPVFIFAKDDHLHLHHVDYSHGIHTSTKLVPIEHVSNSRKKIILLEDENAALREFATTALSLIEKNDISATLQKMAEELKITGEDYGK